MVTMKLYTIEFFVNIGDSDQTVKASDLIEAESARDAIKLASARNPDGNIFWVSDIWESDLFLEELSNLLSKLGIRE